MNLKSLLVPLGMVSLPFALSQCGGSDSEDSDTSGTPTTAGTTTSTLSATTSGPTTATMSTAASTSASASSSSATSSSSSASSSSSTGTSSSTGSSTSSSSASTASTSGSTTGAGGGSSVSSSSGAGGATGAGGTGNVGGAFTLTSSELEEGGEFLPKHTCAMSGFDMDESPPLAWSGAPAEAQSFALVFVDVTLTEQGDMNGYHWVMWDIPASVSELPANLPTGAEITTPVSAKQFNPLSASYLGPCPNFGGGGGGETHTYEFTLYAMPDAETASLAGLNNVQQLEAAIQEVALASTSLSGTSDASPP